MRIILFFILSATPLLGSADWTEQGVYAKCTKDFKIEVGSYNKTNGKPANSTLSMFPYLSKNDQSFVFIDNETHELNCKLANKNISIKFNLEEPSSRGACGAVPGGKIALTIDGVVILNNTTLNNECSQSIEKITISTFSNSTKNLKYEFCGNGNATNFTVRGCIELTNDNFNKLELPLTGFPISKLLKQANAF